MDSTLPSQGTSHVLVAKKLENDMTNDILPSKNLGSFITTSHHSSATLMTAATFHKNQACVEEYGTITKYQKECVSMLANLWGRQKQDSPFGTATTGSSEAIMLAGLSMKRSWQEKATDADQPLNVIIGSNAHACVFKFAAYFDVEPRVVPVTAQSDHVFDVSHLEERIDHRTIGVFLTLGSTFTGHYDPVLEVANYLDAYEARTGINIPIHVDAASGGFVAPFASGARDMIWDFRIPRVQSINASGHKFGFSPCAIGWLVWKDISSVPKSLLVESSYLRGAHTAFTLSFSRSCAPVVVQYLNLLHLGKEGYTEKITSLLEAAKIWSTKLEHTGYFRCISLAGHSMTSHSTYSTLSEISCRSCDTCASQRSARDCKGHAGLPVVVFTFSADFRQRYPWIELSDLGDLMFEEGYSIPHYILKRGGAHGQDIGVLRIVMREDTKLEMETAYARLIENVHKLRDGY